MAKFKNQLDRCDLYAPAGHPDSCQVDAGQVVEIPGVVSAETEDAYILGEGDKARALPKSRWQLVTDPKPADAKLAGGKLDTGKKED